MLSVCEQGVRESSKAYGFRFKCGLPYGRKIYLLRNSYSVCVVWYETITSKATALYSSYSRIGIYSYTSSSVYDRFYANVFAVQLISGSVMVAPSSFQSCWWLGTRNIGGFFTLTPTLWRGGIGFL